MKKFLLFFAVVGLIINVNSQQRAKIDPSFKNHEVKAEKTVDLDGSEELSGAVLPFKATNLYVEEDIGETYYDKQSNRAVANRIYLYPDGTMAANWTFGLGAPGFTDRGTGYNYYDGNEWDVWPGARVETVRCGWPSYAPLGENGEIIVSHNATDALIINKRPERGTGDWTETQIQGPAGNEKVTWPRVVTTGVDNNTVHVLGMIRDYPVAGDMELAYYRSNDGAENWEIMNYEIPGTNHDFIMIWVLIATHLQNLVMV